MPEIPGNSLLQRITLAVDASSYSVANIELAVNMAMVFKTQVHGLFIEDIDLLQIADLPFSTELTLSTAQERKLDVLSLQRSLRVKSLKFRDMLASTAEKSRVKWSFDSVQGRKAEAGLSKNEGTALMIVGHALSHSCSFKDTRDKKRILLFDGNVADLMPVLKALLNVSTAPRIELTLVGVRKHTSTFSQQILEKIQNEDLNLVLSQLDENELQRMMKSKLHSTDYAIASRRNPSDVLRWIIENSVCQVILLG